jgi:hypothetical protein
VSFFKRYKTDQTLEENGVWVDLGEDVHVLVGRLTSKRTREVRRRLMKKYESMREMPPSLEDQINIQVMAESVLLDWRGVTDENNKPIPYSRDAAIKLLTELSDFRDEVAGASMRRDIFRAEELEGNSKA